jgi:hypothetical protein
MRRVFAVRFTILVLFTFHLPIDRIYLIADTTVVGPNIARISESLRLP